MSTPTVRRRLRATLVAVLGLLLAALACGGLVGYRAYLAPPEGSPADFRALTRGPDRPRVVTAGASMVRASLSADWVGAVRARLGEDLEVVNSGVNGDTTTGLLARVDEDVIALAPDAVVLLIGTNDVRNGVPLADSRGRIEETVDRIRAGTGARLTLLSLPPLGEDLDSARNDQVEAYNAMLAATAASRAVDYLPVGEELAALVRARGGATPYRFGPTVSFRAAVDRHLLGRSYDEIAAGNGLRVLTDHVHLSERGGAVVADLVSDWLTRRAP